MKHLVYIDWLRSISMLMIIWGHFFPCHLTSFVYAFNVPVFFILSGMLMHRQATWCDFFARNARTLVLPYVVICLIKALAYIIKHIGDGLFVDSFIGIAAGFHTYNDAPGAKLLWFVYTLLVLKCIYQTGLLGCRWLVDMLVVIISVVAAYYYSSTSLADDSWAVGNALLAMPFFMLGLRLRPMLGVPYIGNIGISGKVWSALVGLVLLCIVAVMAYGHEPAWMYEGHYGDNILMFYVLALLASFALLLVSIALNGCDWRMNRILSAGGLLILGFQYDLIHPLRKVVALVSNGDDWTHPVATFLASVVILLAFVPLTMIAVRWFPFLVGFRGKKNV